MKIILTEVLNPDRKIAAIKALRNATRSPGGAVVLSLLDAKHIVEDVIAGLPTAVEVETCVPLQGVFDGTDPAAIPKQDVLDFVLDVLTVVDRDCAQSIMRRPSYGRLMKALYV